MKLVLHSFVVAAACAVVVECDASPLQVQGKFQWLRVEAQGEMPVVREGAFTILLDGCRWLIRSETSGASLDYVEAGADRSSEICLLASHRTETDRDAGMASTTNGVERDVAFAILQKGTIPHFREAEEIGVLWLAYASSCYFATNTTHFCEPVFWLGGEAFFDRGFLLPGHWRLQREALQVPLDLTIYNDGYIRGLDARHEPRTLRHNEPYSLGYTNAVYRASVVSRHGGILIPMEGSLTLYRPKPTGVSTNELLQTRIFSFQATAVSWGVARPSFLPAVQGRTSVTDRRFLSPDQSQALRYTITNSWPSRIDFERDPKLRAALSTSATQQDTWIRTLVRGSLIGFAVVGLVLFYWSCKARTKNAD